ncbi:transcription-repair coupling factor (superfamily II helicase) [Allopseudospirillum japonicum]|uniref:Transcription-repair-coupling factor n=1 Tax=Allopseudospirillum japonicum TaxID=64971 RepID=A0A1H6QC70_9GAMM|nr:transcription-repair coupling factor [Allopseudospirillum japonicum]SEI37807.1 transcription-repair coupling factor (superfamily II helicase) [Allopseudospirillum japonicum]
MSIAPLNMQRAPVFDPPLPTTAGQKWVWQQVHGVSDALALVQASQKASGPLLVVTQDMSQCQHLVAGLKFFAPQNWPVISLPDWETLPYDTFSPHADIISERLYTLASLPSLAQGILVVPASTLVQKLAPPEHVMASTLTISAGQTLDFTQLTQTLVSLGYRRVDTVYEHGEFALRGSLLDIFPMGQVTGVRIECFDTQIESLRTFDVDTQRTQDQLQQLSLLPAREIPLHTQALAHFREAFQTEFEVDVHACPLYKEVMQGHAASGVEYYLPLFFKQTASLFDYLPANTLMVEIGDINTAIQEFWAEVQRRYQSLRHDTQRPCLPPQHLYLRFEQVRQAVKTYAQVWIAPPRLVNQVKPSHAHDLATQIAADVSVQPKAAQPLAKLIQIRQKHPKYKVILAAESAGRRQALLDLLAQHQMYPHPVEDWAQALASQENFLITLAPLDQGLWLDDPGLILITENQLFGQPVLQRRRRAGQKNQDSEFEIAIRSLSELTLGAPVVHNEYGIGRYQGLQTLQIDGQAHEFLTLVYADEAKVYVPVANLDLISRYTGASAAEAPLHKLGSDQWEKAKRKAIEKIRDTAAELLDVYAQRALRQGVACQAPDQEYTAFAAGFPFEETPDQENAIAAVIQDMCAPQPMDRVICGDVGFGKTEVAMRAAFLAVQGGMQVAVLVPTTLLAQQHYDNFCDRFADWPVKIGVISRFGGKKSQDQQLKALEEGQLDIIIGTHKLLQPDVNFKNLGLVIIDEEHRFGVQQKERFKALRAQVDILTMTATPIPRTLNLAMSGLRDMSIIATPPARRLSVKTFVRPRDPALIKEAILREVLRGGQVYYLHNEVKTIENCAQDLTELLPELSIGVAHGQMPERQLERVMSAFYHQNFNVLVCSTIIETGIDVPNANTIIIERADKFGLAQLHQLRGRVGRSHHQAYAYLLTPAGKKLTREAEQRLQAIANTTDLGAGFTLATHDLEIRGAGELLGAEQSGQMAAIGFSLYTDLLEQAIQSLREGRQDIETQVLMRPSIEVNLHLPALIPETYLADVHTRLMMYKRIASAKTEQALVDLQVEMIDRFGLLPEALQRLFSLTRLKLRLAPLGAKRLDLGETQGFIEFNEHPQINTPALVSLMQAEPKTYRFDGANQRLKWVFTKAETEQARIQWVHHLLTELAWPESSVQA